MPKGFLALALNGASELLTRLPLEKWLIKPRDTSKDREELRKIVGGLPAEGPPTRSREDSPDEEETAERDELLTPRSSKVRLQHKPDMGPTTEETVAYENREIAKNLIQLERHYTQKLTIAGKRCDCGAGRHLLAIEGLCEEALSMVDNPDVYERLIAWVKAAAPKSTEEAAKSGRYDEEYVAMAHQARDFRKEIMGTLDVKALFPQKPGPQKPADIAPVESDQREASILRRAHDMIDSENEPAQGGSPTT